jgi:hypothetical protein
MDDTPTRNIAVMNVSSKIHTSSFAVRKDTALEMGGKAAGAHEVIFMSVLNTASAAYSFLFVAFRGLNSGMPVLSKVIYIYISLYSQLVQTSKNNNNRRNSRTHLQ